MLTPGLSEKPIEEKSPNACARLKQLFSVTDHEFLMYDLCQEMAKVKSISNLLFKFVFFSQFGDEDCTLSALLSSSMKYG